MNWEVPEYDEFLFNEKKHKYCLLIPLMNEGNRFLSQEKKMQKNGLFDKVDVIICDAGSTDGTTDHEFLKRENFRALLVRRGKGRYSTDLRMGYSWAINQGYEGFITVDGNDKDDTSAIDLFVKLLDKGYDYIQGSRYVKGGQAIRTPLIRTLALKIINEPVMAVCAHKHLSDTTNGFRAYSKKFMLDERVLPFRDIFWGYELIYYLPISACRLGFRVAEVPVTRAYPENGEVPTKVGGLKGNIYQLSILHHCIWKHYNPGNENKLKKRGNYVLSNRSKWLSWFLCNKRNPRVN